MANSKPAARAAPSSIDRGAAPLARRAAAVVPSDESISQALGQRIKDLRARTKLTLEELARRSGVSRSMLSTIERGEKSPTLPIIVRIASGFGVSLSKLLGAEPDCASVSVIRAGEHLAFRDPESGFERLVLSPEHLDNGVEFVRHRLPPGRSTGVLPPYAAPTEKYLVVTEGQLTAYVDDRPHVLRAGDSMYFEVKSPYRFVNDDGRTACTYFMVITRRR